MKSTSDRIILKTRWGTLIDSPTKCDECQEVKPQVTQYSKSNRTDRVSICNDCAPRVLARSFPHSRTDNSRDDEYIWNEKFDNDDLEIPSDDAMNRSLDGSFGTRPRR
jgi:hypothetical protein